MEERARGAFLPRPAEADWPRMDPPNVLWFFGAFAIAIGVSAVVSATPDAHNGLWRLFLAIGFMLAFAALSRWLQVAGWWVPGGLAAWLVVAAFPGVAVSFLQLVELWPDAVLFDPLESFSTYPFGVAVTTALVGWGAFAITRFSFILALVVGAILVASQLLTPAFGSSPSGESRATMALVAGALLVVAGVFLDAFGRRRDAFWFHVLGWLSVAAGLVAFTYVLDGDPERGWVPILIVGLLMLIAAGPMGRATWAVYGVLGFYAAFVYYLQQSLDDNGWPFALLLLAVGLAIFVQGMLIHRYGRIWAQRFVRRPPPEVH